MPESAREFDPAERIRTPEDARLWLKAFEEDATPAELSSAIGDVARAYGIAQISRETGIPIKALFDAVNRHPPDTSELLPILDALTASRSADAAE